MHGRDRYDKAGVYDKNKHQDASKSHGLRYRLRDRSHGPEQSRHDESDRIRNQEEDEELRWFSSQACQEI